MRACNTNSCPVGVATQKEDLRQRLVIQSSAKQLSNFLLATNDLMKVVARACGYNNFNQFNKNDLSTFNLAKRSARLNSQKSLNQWNYTA